MNISKRLDRLEQQHYGDGFGDLHAWERAGRLYSDLTDAERERFCLYWKMGDRKGFEQMYHTFGWSLDFPVCCEKKYTPEEWRERVREVEELVLAHSEKARMKMEEKANV